MKNLLLLLTFVLTGLSFTVILLVLPEPLFLWLWAISCQVTCMLITIEAFPCKLFAI